MTAYEVTWRPSVDSNKEFTWLRFAENLESAIESATKSLNYQTYGEGFLISVREAD